MNNWLAVWSDEMADLNATSPNAKTISYGFLETYGLLNVALAAFTALNLLFFIFGALRVRLR